jgi:mannose-6-phosphate isomerase-like protein (cupin superfamily)
MAATTTEGIVTARLDELELHEGWLEGDVSVHARFAFPMFWATGNASTAVLYVELDPGKGGPRHTDTPEELVLILEGEVEVSVGDEHVVAGVNELVLIPSMVPHSFRNVGSTTARIIGFFSANAVVARFQQPVQPIGTRTLGTPTPDMVEAATAGS